MDTILNMFILTYYAVLNLEKNSNLSKSYSNCHLYSSEIKESTWSNMH